jgi:3-oxoacyl-[acyl-carrier-protein] synthase II
VGFRAYFQRGRILKSDNQRIVITGIGLTAPNGNNLGEFRNALLEGKSGITHEDIRYMGQQVAGLCDFEDTRYQKKKAIRRGTRAGSISIYCSNEAVLDAGLDMENIDKSRVGVFLGITEHGNVETENEIFNLHENNLDTALWSPHHNPRTVSNNPAGEITLNMGITGPHYTIGSACAGGNAGLIQGVQQILLGEVDIALAGGISESPRTFGIFAAFAAQGALANDEDPTNAIRPLDKSRKGTVISEGGCIYTLETLEHAKNRNAKIHCEVVGWAMNSDATDFVNPNAVRQMECMKKAMNKAGIDAGDIDIVSMHATATGAGDVNESQSINMTFSNTKACINFTKGHIGHTMGAAGALELAGNIPSFVDGVVHPGLNCKDLDPECAIDNLVLDDPKNVSDMEYILNNSFGMVGINSAVIVKKYSNS